MKKVIYGVSYGMLLAIIAFVTILTGFKCLSTFPKYHNFPNRKDNAVEIIEVEAGMMSTMELVRNDDGWFTYHYHYVHF